MKLFSFILALGVLSPSLSYAENIHLSSLEIKFIRAVGDYTGSAYDNTIELWFIEPLVWSSPSCTDTRRVYIDSKHQHIISAAYTPFATNKKVNVHVDSTLPKRGGACEVSYLDILKS
ncbi:hypothetical protein AB6E04_00880 [Vibrio amylolyticus]|uniref:hypothetical protein n=1 Tax=Vibrio amylolyticus TaxID=2847292 RepID=UPI003550CC6E